MKLKMNWIESILLNVEEDEITLSATIPGDDGGTTSWERTYELSSNWPPQEVKEAAARFVEVMVKYADTPEPIRCDTCTGNCCKHYDTIRVTREDLQRMAKAGISLRDQVTLWDGAEWPDGADMRLATEVFQSIDGSVGYMKTRPWDGYQNDDRPKDKACINLKKDGCSIYEHRPEACRNYPAQGCEIYEADPKKVDGKVKLRVLAR